MNIKNVCSVIYSFIVFNCITDIRCCFHFPFVPFVRGIALLFFKQFCRVSHFNPEGIALTAFSIRIIVGVGSCFLKPRLTELSRA